MQAETLIDAFMQAELVVNAAIQIWSHICSHAEAQPVAQCYSWTGHSLTAVWCLKQAHEGTHEKLVEGCDFVDPNPVHQAWGPSHRDSLNSRHSGRSVSMPRSASSSSLSFVGAVEFGALLGDDAALKDPVHAWQLVVLSLPTATVWVW